ncbi:TPA: hypothetical protein ENG04_01660, partial [Candidatus Poribacteria bacterium]|nr:hypothetical protein [Candidatus Poribacteria bacterium]HEX28768.1 hypothetical protein [Candidatus Poribacteria bacterium]
EIAIGDRTVRITDYVTLRVDVEEKYDLALLPPEPDPFKVIPGKASVLLFPLSNFGNARDTFTFSVSIEPDPSNKSEAQPSDWNINVGEPNEPIEYISLNPGDSYNVPVYLVPPESLFVGDKAVVKLTVTSDGDPSRAVAAQLTLTAVDTKRPRPPENLTVIDTPDDQGGSITLRWTRSPDDGQGQNDVTCYYIYRSESAGNYSSRHTYTISLSQPGDNVQLTEHEVTFVDTDVIDGTEYFYVVTAFDGEFESEPSNESSAAPADNIPPPKVEKLRVQDPGSGGRLIISWNPDPAPDLAGYKLYYDTDISDGSYDGKDAAEGESPIEFDKDTTQIELTGLRNLLASEPDESLLYHIAVTALDMEGNESEPSTASGTPTGPELEFEPDRFELLRNIDTVPSEELILRNLGRRTLNFNVSSDVDWLQTEPEKGEVNPGSELSIKLRYTGDLKDGEYNCKLILSTDDPDNEEVEIPVRLTIDLTPPEPPQAVEVGDTLEGGSLMISWGRSPSEDVAGYLVYWGAEKGPPYEGSSDQVSATEFQITGLENGVEYHIAVSAVDAHGNQGPPSREITSTPHKLVSHSKDITKPETWRYGEIHEIKSDICVRSRIAIEPGVVIKLKKGASLAFVYDNSVAGTVERPVIFTSWADDSAGGDTNGDGNTTTPDSLHWESIKIAGEAKLTFEHCQFKYGGGNNNGMIYLTGGTLRMQSCLISHSLSDGVYVESGSASIEGCKIADSSRYSITIPFNQFDSVVGNDLSGERGVRLRYGNIKGGNMAREVVWENPGVPIFLTERATIEEGSSLKIAPGTILK